MLLKIKNFKYLKQINFEINKKEFKNLFKKCFMYYSCGYYFGFSIGCVFEVGGFRC